MSSLQQVLEGFSHLDVEADVPLAPWTSVRVGGNAERLVQPRALPALAALLGRMKARGVPLTVLGGGANTLVSDAGVEGITVKLPNDGDAEALEERPDGPLAVTLSAGAPIARLVNLMRKHGRVGVEFLAGIPGSIGGATRMNAGTQHGEASSRIEAVELAMPDWSGWVPVAKLQPGYRHTELLPYSVIMRVRFVLPPGDVTASRAAMESDLGYRKRTQPLSQPNFGSVFANPPGDHAGRLLEAAGLKGLVQGGAQVSPLHANWIVNTGGAKASDVVALMDRMRSEVQARSGVTLRAEVQYAGRF